VAFWLSETAPLVLPETALVSDEDAPATPVPVPPLPPAWIRVTDTVPLPELAEAVLPLATPTNPPEVPEPPLPPLAEANAVAEFAPLATTTAVAVALPPEPAQFVQV
jgi:hypothetical protein